jgi:hypothetical protein
MNRAGGITAGVLALAVGGYQAWVTFQLTDVASILSGSLGSIARFYGWGAYEPVLAAWPTVEVVLSAVAALVLVIGALMVLAGKSIGRRLIIAGCVIVVAHTSIGWAVAAWFVHLGSSAVASLWFDTPSKLAIVVLSFVAPIVAVISALHPAMRRSCRGDPTRAIPSDLRRSA